LTHLIDWAETGTLSTLFSCLAAHAAVLHLDGIARRPLTAKLSGVYDSVRVEDDPLFFGAAPPCRCPIRAATTLPKAIWWPRTIACWRVWTLKMEVGPRPTFLLASPPARAVSSFSKAIRNMTPAPWREYLRDMGRFLQGETGERPAVPEHYFDRATEDRLAEIAGHGESDLPRYHEVVLGALPRQVWRPHTVRLFQQLADLGGRRQGQTRDLEGSSDPPRAS